MGVGDDLTGLEVRRDHEAVGGAGDLGDLGVDADGGTLLDTLDLKVAVTHSGDLLPTNRLEGGRGEKSSVVSSAKTETVWS